jgi:hypothetical protein
MLKSPILKSKAATRASHLWQTESFDRVIRDRAELQRTHDYIRRNPMKLPPGAFIYHQAEWLDNI